MSRVSGPESTRRALAWQVPWLLLLAGIALVAAGLQIDREARRNPDLSDIVPRPFRSFAQQQIVGSALSQQDSAGALAEAKRLVLIRPMPAENLSLLAVAAGLDGKDGVSRQAITVSAARGWRDPLAQAYAAQLALDSGQWDAAFYRAIALWSMDRQGTGTVEALNRIEASAEGRGAIVRWLEDTYRARDNFIGWGALHLDPEAHGETIRKAVRAGVAVPCPTLSRAASTLLKLGSPSAARNSWTGPCALGSPLRGDDLRLAPRGPGEAGGPFGWTAADNSSFMSDGEAGTWSLEYENGEPGYHPAAECYSGIAPGSYRVSINSAEQAGLRVRLRMTCIGEGGKRLRSLTVRAGDAANSLEIPGYSCAAQHFELLAPRGHGVVTDLRLDPA